MDTIASPAQQGLTDYTPWYRLKQAAQRLRAAFADGLPPCLHRSTHHPVCYLEHCWSCGRVRRLYRGTWGAWHKEVR